MNPGLWLTSGAGQAAFPALQHLIESLMTGWPRRGRRLLLIGPDPGFYSRWLWTCGFDVTLAGSDPETLNHARAFVRDAAELQLAQPDHLPWPTDAFDYAISFFAFQASQRQAALLEAVRVARSALIVVFGDSWALGRWLVSNLPAGGAWWAVRQTLRAAHPGPLRSASVLVGTPRLSWVSRLPLLLPGFGPCCGIRHDFEPVFLRTPLLAWRPGVEIS